MTRRLPGQTAAPRRGLTLVETLVAMAILAALSLGMLGFVRELRDGGRALEEAAEQQTGVAVLFDAIERACATSVAWNVGGAPGFQGSATSLRIAFLASTVPSPLGSRPVDAPEVLEARADGAGTVLLNRNQAGGQALPPEPVLTGVRRMRIRYHDGAAWLDAYDSASARALPRAIEVAIWFGSPAPAPGPRTPSAMPDAEPTAAGDVLSVQSAPDDDGASAPIDWGEPDRLRIIAIPDGGVVEPTETQSPDFQDSTDPGAGMTTEDEP